MFRRFKWFGVAFAVVFTVFVYRTARFELTRASVVHPILAALVSASMFAVVGNMRVVSRCGREGLAGAGFFSMIFGAILPALLTQPDSLPLPVMREGRYVFPAWGDYLLIGALVFNFVFALLMALVHVPARKMLLVNGQAYYAGERPLFLPWMKCDVEKLDEFPVTIDFHCASGTRIMCEAVLMPEVEWCRKNGVTTVNAKQFADLAAQMVKHNIVNRAELRNVCWTNVGEVLDAFAALNPLALEGTAAGVKFCCRKFTATATTTKAVV